MNKHPRLLMEYNGKWNKTQKIEFWQPELEHSSIGYSIFLANQDIVSSDGSTVHKMAPFVFAFIDSNFILGNARVVDHPIVYANEGFCKITGHSRAEVMQQSSMLRFLWNESTDGEVIIQMEEAFKDQKMLQVQISVSKKSSK